MRHIKIFQIFCLILLFFILVLMSGKVHASEAIEPVEIAAESQELDTAESTDISGNTDSTSEDAANSEADNSNSTGDSNASVMSGAGAGENDALMLEWSNKPVGVSSGGNSGAAVTSIPIVTPPGRNGIEPRISLNYNSNSGNGWIGVGWGVDMGAIQRNTKRGVNYNADDYVVTVNGSSSELVPRGDWGANYYGAKIEGAFSKYYKVSDTGGWVITTKNGTKYYYGTTLDGSSRQDNYDPDTGQYRVFKWCLDKVQDTNGNYMTISYWKNQGEIYLDRIDYTGNTAGLSPANYVNFYRESRSDAPDMYGLNSSVRTAYRLKTIAVVSNGSLARAYKYSYTYSGNTGRSLLASVQQFGADAQVNSDGSIINELSASKLPALIFESQVMVDDWMDSLWSGPGLGEPVINQCMTGDINGDSKTDMWCYTGSNGLWDMVISHGDGWTDSLWNGPSADASARKQCIAGDINGDGKTDMWCYTGSNGLWDMAISYGIGWTDSLWSGPSAGVPVSNRCIAGDINGDGKTDMWCYTGSNGLWDVAISHGDGWTDSLRSGPSAGVPVSNRCITGDINGDGKTDMWCYTGSNGFWDVAISHGNGWTDSQWSGPSAGVPVINRCIAGDINGDGKTDMWCYTGSNGLWDMAISHGNGWTDSLWSGPSADVPVSNLCMTGDVTGDSRSDIWCNTGSGGYWHTALPAGEVPDLLYRITNSLQGKSTIAYTPSSSYQNTLLPFIVQTVSSITVNDGNGNLSTSVYDYSGGYFDYADKEYRGFQYMKATALT